MSLTHYLLHAGFFSLKNKYDKSYYSVSDNGYLLHNYTYPSGSSYALRSVRVRYQPSYLAKGTRYYSYDGHYFYTDFSVMIADYRNNTYNNAVNKSAPHYNYYQYC